MGIVIDFPSRDVAVVSRGAASAAECGQIVILPVIRIERYDDEPSMFLTPTGKGDSSRKRRRRASRS